MHLPSLLLFVAIWLGLQAPAMAQAPQSGATPEQAACLKCHESQAKKIEVPGKDGGKPRALGAVAADGFGKGSHAAMQCTACHTDVKDNAEKGSHAQPDGRPIAKPDCLGCHQALQDKVKQGQAKDSPGLAAVHRNIEDYRKSLHAKKNADDPTRPNAGCSDCHNAHTFKPVAKGTPAHTALRGAIGEQCGKCHEDQLEAYESSVHAKHNKDKGDGKAATCTDCHSAHAVSNTSAERFKVGMPANCGDCHKERLETFRDTFHGQVVTLGYGYTAKCYDCHGSHDILKASDAKSKVHPDNLLKTCRSCHNEKKGLPDVPAGFATFQPHADPFDFKKFPEVSMAYWGMVGLLVGTFGFFWLHTILWFYREWKERKARGGHLRVQLDEVPPAARGMHIQRFPRVQRIAHLLFALSLMVLTLTGMPLFYPMAPWADDIMRMIGGPRTAGFVHRISAVVFAGVFFWHLFYVAWRIAKSWKTFKFLGPDSLIPWIQDGKDMLGMFKWFLGMGPRPQFDRWTYWEKFDYWAPFWGVTIIGVSGLVMWLPHVFGAFLPGWVFNVAAIMHGEEAFLAVVFLFTVHFFNNHFRPDKFPVEVVMFTGTFSLEEFKREHPLEYDRLVASGELEKRLVAPPTAGQMSLARGLGFVLIVIGLTLLTLVAVGFVTQ